MGAGDYCGRQMSKPGAYVTHYTSDAVIGVDEAAFRVRVRLRAMDMFPGTDIQSEAEQEYDAAVVALVGAARRASDILSPDPAHAGDAEWLEQAVAAVERAKEKMS